MLHERVEGEELALVPEAKLILKHTFDLEHHVLGTAYLPRKRGSGAGAGGWERYVCRSTVIGCSPSDNRRRQTLRTAWRVSSNSGVSHTKVLKLLMQMLSPIDGIACCCAKGRDEAVLMRFVGGPLGLSTSSRKHAGWRKGAARAELSAVQPRRSSTCTWGWTVGCTSSIRVQHGGSTRLRRSSCRVLRLG